MFMGTKTSSRRVSTGMGGVELTANRVDGTGDADDGAGGRLGFTDGLFDLPVDTEGVALGAGRRASGGEALHLRRRFGGQRSRRRVRRQRPCIDGLTDVEEEKDLAGGAADGLIQCIGFTTGLIEDDWKNEWLVLLKDGDCSIRGAIGGDDYLE